jgi:hypothetical protein
MRMGRTQDLLQAGQQVEIVARGVSTHAFAGAVGKDGGIIFSVPADVQRQMLEQVWTLGGDVISVNPVRRSLEQMFLEVTSDAEKSKVEGGW